MVHSDSHIEAHSWIITFKVIGQRIRSPVELVPNASSSLHEATSSKNKAYFAPRETNVANIPFSGDSLQLLKCRKHASAASISYRQQKTTGYG